MIASATSLLAMTVLSLPVRAQASDTAAASATPPAQALTADGDPVLVQFGGTREHASFVLERFEIAVRGVASNQGLEYDTALFEQLYGFLPTFLRQRATELVLMAQAEARGIVVGDEHVDAVVDRLRLSLGRDDDAYAAALAAAGFRSEEHLRVMVRESELVRLGAEAIRAAIEVSPDQVVVAYHAQRDRFTTGPQVCARHVLVPDLAQAEALIGRLHAGEDFADLARSESLDAASAVRGGDLGCIRPGLTVPAFDEALFSASGPGLVGPVQTQFGFHVIDVSEVRAARTQPLEEVWAELERERAAELGEAALAAIIEAAGVRTFPDRIPPLDGTVEPTDVVDPAAGV